MRARIWAVIWTENTQKGGHPWLVTYPYHIVSWPKEEKAPKKKKKYCGSQAWQMTHFFTFLILHSPPLKVSLTNVIALSWPLHGNHVHSERSRISRRCLTNTPLVHRPLSIRVCECQWKHVIVTFRPENSWWWGGSFIQAWAKPPRALWNRPPWLSPTHLHLHHLSASAVRLFLHWL